MTFEHQDSEIGFVSWRIMRIGKGPSSKLYCSLISHTGSCWKHQEPAISSRIIIFHAVLSVWNK